MWLPDIDEVLGIHYALVEMFVDEDDPIEPAGIRDRGLLESAINRPHTGIGGVDKYKKWNEKIGSLFYSLVKNHAFHNGNKRTALVSLLTALYRNDKRLKSNVDDNEVFDFVVNVAAGQFPSKSEMSVDEIVRAISNWIKSNSESARVRLGDMRIADFIRCCENAGASSKLSGGSFVISHSGDSIRISKSTHKVHASAVRSYLRKLNLQPVSTGVDIVEFAAGATAARSQIYRFGAVLRRLAKT